MIEDGLGAARKLACFDPDASTQDELLDLLVLVQQHAGWVASVQASILAALADRMVGSGDEKEFLSEEVGLVMRLPSGSVGCAPPTISRSA